MKQDPTVKKILQLAEESCRAIDENPFIMKKNNWLWRMAGGKMSQVDYMKQRVLLQAKIAICDYLLEKTRLKMAFRSSQKDKDE